MKSTSQPVGLSLEVGALGAEADDHGAAIDVAQCLEQHLHALVVDQLAEVDDGRDIAREKLGQPLGVVLVRQPLARVAGVGRIGAGLGQQAPQGVLPGLRQPGADVDTGRHGADALDRSADLGDDVADVLGADDHRGGAGHRFCTPARELLVAAHRVLELRAVGGHGVARARRLGDRAAENHVAGDDEIGRQSLAHRRGIGGDPGVEFGARRVLHALHAIAVVLVDHEDRQEPADIRADRRGAAEVVLLGVRVL